MKYTLFYQVRFFFDITTKKIFKYKNIMMHFTFIIKPLFKVKGFIIFEK